MARNSARTGLVSHSFECKTLHLINALNLPALPRKNMGSRKPSANMKRVQQFKSQLGGLDDLFALEQRREEQLSEEKEAAQRLKTCESKNRYASKSEAQSAISSCEEYGKKGLKTYRCPYCAGWHLTSHPWD